ADGDQQAGPLVVRQQHRDVLARAGSGKRHRGQAEVLQPLQTRRAAIPVGVYDQLRAAAQRVVGDRVHVADDDVGAVAGLDQRIGATVDGEQYRSVLPDVGPQRLEVLAVVVTADDDQNVATLERRTNVRYAGTVEKQIAFTPQELHRVGGKRFQLYGEAGASLSHGSGHSFDRTDVSLRHRPSVEV